MSGITIGARGPVSQLQAWSGWNGTGFTTQKVLYSAPAGILLNGIAFGADGRLYSGVDVGLTNDHGPKKGLLYDLLSFNAAGKGMKVFATGMRQPWQLAFPKGSSSPFVTDLGQDKPASVQKTVPDFILRVRAGQNYGFPSCNWIVTSQCTKFATPFKFLAPHTDPGGLGIIGNQLYLSEFGFAGTAKVQSMLGQGRLPEDPADRVQARGVYRARDERRMGLRRRVGRERRHRPGVPRQAVNRRSLYTARGRRFSGALVLSRNARPTRPAGCRTCSGSPARRSAPS